VVVRPDLLLQLAGMAAEAGATLLVDEVYRDILFEDAPASAVQAKFRPATKPANISASTPNVSRSNRRSI
jgi:aspartate/methionine/tyrosine aminotransferase